jgi:sugar phosphate isomerase/epimerase
MKYAFMSFSAPQLKLGELLELAARVGYDGIEPRIGSNHAHGIELETSAAQRRAIREQAAASGVALCCVATSCKYADPATAPRWVEETRRAIELAAEIGAPRLRVFGGALGQGLTRAQAIELVADSLGAVAGDAQQHGVTICLETHDDWTDPAHVADVLSRVDSPAVAVNWDYQHTTRIAGTTVDQAFTTLQPWIKHVHFHDGVNRADKLIFLPVGAGVYDNRRVVELLLGMGYDGYLSGEWIDWEPYDVHLPRELAAMKGLEREATGAAR